MSFKLHAALITVGLMSFGYCVAPAAADDWDKATTFQFNAPVEVPGHVLIPGTYVFKLADLSDDRAVVRVFSEDKHGMDHLVTTAFAVPAYRVIVADKPIITFEERRSNNPEAVHSWFYPGEHDGWEFVFPKMKAIQVASNTPAPPPAPAPVAPAAAPQPAPQPAAAPAVVEKEQTVIVAQNQAPTPQNEQPSQPKELPKTASDFPLVAVFGLLSLSSGAAVLGFGFLRNNA